MLQNICHEMGLKQFIREPTRDAYLLDLVLSDVDLQCEVGPTVADHAYVCATMHATIEKTTTQKRTVWNFARADWKMLQDRLDYTEWLFLQRVCPNEGAAKMT